MTEATRGGAATVAEMHTAIARTMMRGRHA